MHAKGWTTAKSIMAINNLNNITYHIRCPTKNLIKKYTM